MDDNNNNGDSDSDGELQEIYESYYENSINEENVPIRAPDATNNMCIRLTRREIGSSVLYRYYRGYNVPIQYMPNPNNDDAELRSEMVSIFTSLSELHRAYEARKFDDALICVKKIYNALNLNRKNVTRVNRLIDSADAEFLEFFVQVNGIEVLLKLFEIQMSDPNYAETFPSDFVIHNKDLWIYTCGIMKRIMLKFPYISARYLTNAHLQYLVTLLFHDCLFECSIRLVEVALVDRLQPITLATIPRLEELLLNLDIVQTAKFCRLLSLLVHDKSKNDKRSISNQKFDVVACNNIVNMNQMYLLENNIFLDRLIMLVNTLTYGPSLDEMATYYVSNKITTLHLIVTQILTGQTGQNEWTTINQYHDCVKYYKSTRNFEYNIKLVDDIYIPTVDIIDDNDSDFDEEIEDKNVEFLTLENNDHDVFEPSRLNSRQIIAALPDYVICELPLHFVKDMFGRLIHYYYQNDDDYENFNIFANGRQAVLEELNNFTCHMTTTGTMDGFVKSITSKTISQIETAKIELEYYALCLLQYQLDILFTVSNLLSGERRHYFKSYSGNFYSFGDSLIDMLEKMTITQGQTVLLTDFRDVRTFPGQCFTVIRNFFEVDNLDFGPPLFNILERKKLLYHVINITISRNREDAFLLWLNTCLRCFVKSCDFNDHKKLAESGLIQYIVLHFLECDDRSPHQLKSGLDTLAEIIIANHNGIQILEATLNNVNFNLFFSFVRENVEASVKFVKALFWTIHHHYFNKLTPITVLTEGRKFIANVGYIGSSNYLQERRQLADRVSIMPMHKYGRLENLLKSENRYFERLNLCSW